MGSEEGSSACVCRLLPRSGRPLLFSDSSGLAPPAHIPNSRRQLVAHFRSPGLLSVPPTLLSPTSFVYFCICPLLWEAFLEFSSLQSVIRSHLPPPPRLCLPLYLSPHTHTHTRARAHTLSHPLFSLPAISAPFLCGPALPEAGKAHSGNRRAAIRRRPREGQVRPAGAGPGRTRRKVPADSVPRPRPRPPPPKLAGARGTRTHGSLRAPAPSAPPPQT